MIKKCAILAVAAIYLSGCTTTDPYTGEQKMSNTAGGALIGAGLGAATGLLVGGSAAGRRDSALVGAAIGGLGGGLIGNYMDNQEAELRAQLQGTGVSVTRAGDRIMPSNITFATDRDQVIPAFYDTLNSVAIVLRKFNKTMIDVDGHTDATGSASYNQGLSERRAASVANYLAGQGVDQRRMSAMGYGKERPIASNGSEAGRAQNRRVEISIAPIKA
ncbi:OmpA family protein [Ensifer sp. ENS06]|uniref:OmpA family protein n=1 Tax=Ensifer sp. ENS06 TaxID=2769276 RepID=UPI00177E32DB|nr:OmpA family protein [Ensifer sp. ENS06]MBD9621503.1 OmpA family protein [Ensifer sp. ENS06]